MQAILQATQKDASESHELAVSMKEDSVAMKTVRYATLCYAINFVNWQRVDSYSNNGIPTRDIICSRFTSIPSSPLQNTTAKLKVPQALLSMPFFNTNSYMTSTRRLWIWVLLAVPSTVGAFVIYWFLTGQRRRRIKKEVDKDASADVIQNPNQASSKPGTSTAQSSTGENIPMQPMEIDTV